MTVQQLVELGAVALGEAGGVGHVAVGHLEQAREVVTLEVAARVLERVELGALDAQRVLDQRRADHRAGGQRDHLLDDVDQFAHIAGPVVLHQESQRIGREGVDGLAVPGGDLPQEVTRQQRDVLAPLAHWRQREAHHVQAVVQILAETCFADRGFEVAMRGRDDANVDRRRLRRTDRADGAFLQDPQQFHLQRDRHVADFIEQHRAALGRLKQADVVAGGAGEGAACMAEQFRFEQRFRDGTAVDGHERAIAPRTGAMDGLCEQFLAGAALAAQQNAGVADGDQLGSRQHGLERRIAGDDALLPVAGGVAGDRGRCRHLRGAGDLRYEVAAVERLGEVAEHAALRCSDRVGNRAVGSENDDRQRRIAAMDLLEQRHAVHAAHAQVGDDHLRGGGREHGERALAALGGHDIETRRPQADRHQSQQVGIVVDQQHFCRGSAHFFLAF